MLSLASALDHLRGAAFKVRIERNSCRNWEWGTAFFISPDGFALTAFHNLPRGVVSEHGGSISGYYQGLWITLDCLIFQSLPEQEGDIALLKWNEAPPTGLDHITIAYLDPALSIRERSQFWAGRPVCAFGFPFEDVGQAERLVDGNIDSVQPIVVKERTDLHGGGPEIVGTTEWLRFYAGQRARELYGISGAPILDRETGWVAAVEHRFFPGLELVYGTEIGRLAGCWPELRSHAQPLHVQSAVPATLPVSDVTVERRFFPLELVYGLEVGRLAGSWPESRSHAQPLHVQSAVPATLPVSGTAPPVPALVVGREEAMSELRSRLQPAVATGRAAQLQVLTAVRGWPGIGKTTIAAALASDPEVARMFPDGTLWTSLGQAPDVLGELAAWGRALGRKDILSIARLEEAKSVLAAILRDRRMLLIVDDVWESAHAMAFRVGGRHCAMLVTTRLPGVAQAVAPTPNDIYTLAVLSENHGYELLALLAPGVVAAYPEQSRELVRELEGLPLAIQVAGRLLQTEAGFGFGVTQLLVDLRDGARLLESVPPADRTDISGETTPTVAALLRKSTDLLDAPTRRHFAELAVFAPKPAAFDFGAICAVWGDAVPDPKATLRVLMDRGLLDPKVETGRFQMHALLVLHARSLSE